MKKRNLRHNRAIESKLPQGYISGQQLGTVSSMRYGLCRMSFNGCECISVYNALLHLGRKAPLSEVAFNLERYKMLFGIFGCNPYKIVKCLERFGIAAERTSDHEKNGGYIVSFWTRLPLLSPLHTVFLIKNEDGITVYNRYGNSAEILSFGSVGEMLGKRLLITAYYLKADGK